MAQMEFDRDQARALDAIYRTRDMVRRRRLAREALAAQPGERILDVGCGPGYYVAEIAEEVGESGSVVGVDSSAPMLAVSAQRCAELPNTEFREGHATSLPVEDATFDAALSAQVLEYVEPVGAALAELHRVLRPGGRVALWDVDWGTLSWYSEHPDRMQRVLSAWDEHLADPSLPRTLAPRLREAGFDDVRMDAHPFATTELSPDTYGGSLVAMIEAFVGQTGRAEEAAAWAAEQRELAESGRFYCAVVQLCFTARRA
jgi:ubiquinone/menaquinone biosynthesis C-methylase UbiE